MGRKHVAILMGGTSSEHEVSLASGVKVIDQLDRERYAITPVTIGKDGRWRFADAAPLDVFDAIPELKRRAVDCVFIALHGGFGEDGRLQGMLDMLGIPYTSSGYAASALAIDKIRSKAVVGALGIRVARQIVVDRAQWEADPEGGAARIAAELGWPCVIKSPCQGSSVGMAIPRDPAALRSSAPDVFAYGDLMMAEQFIAGTEVTCGILDVGRPGDPVPLPLTEIRPVSSAFFDYHAKYTPGASLEITPAEIPPALTAHVQEISVRAHQAIGCAIWSRNDLIIDAQGPVWIEINTVPGMTQTSLYPQAAAAVGIAYPQMLGLFIEAAMAGCCRTRKG